MQTSTTRPIARLLALVVSVALLAGSWGAHRAWADAAGGALAGADGASTMRRAYLRYVTAGAAHTCALLDDGTIKCWGTGTNGRLGSGATAALGDGAGEMGDALPVVALGAGRTATQVAAGAAHTCALLDDGTVKCWGLGTDGRLGSGATASLGDGAGEMGDALPAVALGAGRTAVEIAVGGAHGCAVLDDGTVKCWGANDEGQLGLGDTEPRGDGPGEMGDALPAVALGAGRSAVAVAAGTAHTCAVLDDGTLRCWGAGANGRLGLGDQDSRGDGPGEMGDELPAVALGAGRTAQAVAAGDAHTCAILDDATLRCWGAGDDGRVGSGAVDAVGDEPDEAPVTVSLGVGRTVVGVTAGRAHTCALLDDASVTCWGDCGDGAAGLGSSDDGGDQAGEMGDALAAVALGTGRTARAVAAGDAHTCAVLDDATLKCWGSGSGGRLGLGGTRTWGDESGEMGDALATVSLGAGRAIRAVTEPARVAVPTAEAGDGRVALSWEAPSSGGTSILDYVVQYATGPGSSWVTYADGVAESPGATVTGLSNDTAYRFRIVAKNAIGRSAASASVEATPTAPTTTSTTSTTTSTTTTTTPPTTTSTTTSTTSTTTTTTAAPPSGGGGGGGGGAPAPSTDPAPAPTVAPSTTAPTLAPTTVAPTVAPSTTAPAVVPQPAAPDLESAFAVPPTRPARAVAQPRGSARRPAIVRPGPAQRRPAPPASPERRRGPVVNRQAR